MADSETSPQKFAFIDGVALPINQGESILQFAKRQQISIPTLCDDSRLESYGACRVCSVDVALTSDGPTKVMASCHTPISEGMFISTQSAAIQKLRKNIIELVLTDHPLDCLTCESNGNCELQDVAAEVGIREVRYKNAADHSHYQKDLSHPYMRSDLSKCINCYRCVRACDEIQGEFVLGIQGRGFASKIIKGADIESGNLSFNDSACVSCGACAQTCPTAAISDVFQSKAKRAAKTVRTICSYCGVGCNLEVSVKDDKILSITAPEEAQVNAGHTCLKGRYAWRFYNHPDRLTAPLIRKNGVLVKSSWDEAYQLIVEKFSQIKMDFGADALAGISSSRCTNEENYLMQKFMRVAIGTNNIDCCARVCHSPTAFGLQKAFGTGAATNSVKDLDKTEFIMVIGANPTSAHPVTGAKIKQKLMKGLPSVVIDPVKTEIAKYATWHLQLRPGTNVALLNMMSYYIIEADLVDEQFINQRCEDFAEFKQHILSLDMQHLSVITGVEAALVKQAAIGYASATKAMSFHGLGVTEHSQGTRTVMSIANLAMMTGNIGREGVGVNPLRGQNNVQGSADMGCQPHQGSGYFAVDLPENIQKYSDFYGVKMPTQIGLKIPQMYNAAQAGQLKALWIMGEDMAQTDPNQDHVIKSLKSLDFLVVQEIFLSETAKLADVVLPGCSFLEKSGTFTNGERRIQAVNQAVKPLAGTKSDGQIVVDLLNLMGVAQASHEPEEMLSEISQIVPFFAGVKWRELGEQGKQWPVKADGSDTPILHIDSFKRGKGKFHISDWVETKELTNNARKFPFILTTSRLLEHYNAATMTRRTGNELIVDKDILLIHQDDASRKKIKNNSLVKLSSERGEIELLAQISNKVKPGILFTTFHFPELMINRVTGDACDTETMCPEYKVVAVDVAAI